MRINNRTESNEVLNLRSPWRSQGFVMYKHYLKLTLVTVPILYGKQMNALYHSMSSHILLLGAIAMCAPLWAWQWLSSSKTCWPIGINATVFWSIIKTEVVWFTRDANWMWCGRFAVATGCLVMSAGSSDLTEAIPREAWTFCTASRTPNITGSPAECES